MCGRFTLVANQDVLADHFSMPALRDYELNEARFNVTPGQQVPIIHLENNSLRLTQMRWGLIPSWNSSTFNARPINARFETLSSKTMFKKLLNHKRCLIPLSGYYEWHQDTSPKQPYYFTIPYQPIFAVAGLWDQTTTGDGKVYSFTLITKQATEEVGSVHDRMPFILDPQYYQAWLKDPYFQLNNHHLPFRLHSHPVSTTINSPSAQGPELIKLI